MPKKQVKAEVNTFIKGLVTEAGPLNFPPNASLDEVNFELLKNGSRRRRLGMDIEAGGVCPSFLPLQPSEIGSAGVSSYVWNNVSGNADISVLVVQTGLWLTFFDMNNQELGQDGFLGYISFPSTFASNKPYSFTSAEGMLIVANGSYDIYSVSCNTSTFTFTSEAYVLKTRDFWGVDDGTPNDDPYTRVTSDTAARRYNLYNQSWGIPRRWEGIGEKQVTDPVSYYFSQYGSFPSNTETVWLAMTTKADANPYEYMRPNAWIEATGTLPVASKGFFVIDLLKRGSSRVTAIENNKARFPEITLDTISTPADTTPGGASVVTEFAGRVFYAGFSGEVIDGHSSSPILSSYVLFSNVIRSKKDLGRCYQEGDPTSREGNDIVDTDGGYIRLSGVNKIVELRSIGSSLIVFADNGVWAITGGSDYGFSATNYKVSQLSNFGCINNKSIVKTNDSLIYWGVNGIFIISPDQTGQLVVGSLTDETIYTLYAELSPNEKENAFGVYDEVSKTIRWMYSEGSSFGTQSVVHELILDTRIKAFYKYKVTNPSDRIIRGMFTIPISTTLTASNPVVVGTQEVLSNTEAVFVPFDTRSPSSSGVKYLVFLTGEYLRVGFSYYWNQSFKDWDLNDAGAYLLTGAIVASDSSVDKWVPYVTVHSYRTEEGVDSNFQPLNQSSCFLRAQWEWANTITSKKWGQSQQVYRYRRAFIPSSVVDPYDTGFELITTKNKLRGVGRAVSLYFYTEAGKDCHIAGWNMSITGNGIT